VLPLHRSADRRRQRFRVAIGRAFVAGQRSLPLKPLELAMRDKDVVTMDHLAMTGISETEALLSDALPGLFLDACVAGANVALRQLPKFLVSFAANVNTPRVLRVSPPINIAFDKKNPYAIQWARRHSALLVQEITNQSRMAVRQIITAALSEGIPPRESAILIRASVGLTESQAGAVLRLNRALVEGAGKTVKAGKLTIRVPQRGLTRDKLDLALNRYANRLTKYRAETIARTETMRASNEGQRLLWNNAQRKGLIHRSAKREWIATLGGPRRPTCERCLGLNGQTAPINGTFEGGLEHPPAHPRCRCTTALTYN
jgi:hypothetical protein